MPAPLTVSLADMFTDSITVESRTGQDDVGNPTFATGVIRKARISGGGQRRMSAAGVEYVTAGKILFDGAFGVRHGDRLTLPDDFDPKVIFVEEAVPVRDENGPHHDKVFF